MIPDRSGVGQHRPPSKDRSTVQVYPKRIYYVTNITLRFTIFLFQSKCKQINYLFDNSWKKVELASSKSDCNRVDCCETDCKHVRKLWIIANWHYDFLINEISRMSFVGCCMWILSFCQILAPWLSRKILPVNFISFHIFYGSYPYGPKFGLQTIWSKLYTLLYGQYNLVVFPSFF